MISRLSAAIAYSQELHWAVFPCNTDKTPLTSNGFKDASTDVKIITEWWGKWPDASIGIATGAISNILVLDLDVKVSLGITVENSLAEIISKFGNLPTTATSQTGGGGQHLFFRPPEDTPIKSSVAYQGITGVDIRAEGGYIIAPPSDHPSGNAYAWIHDPWVQPLAKAPEFLLLKRKKLKLNIHQTTQEEVIAGQRNNKLTSLGGLLRSMGLDFENIFNVLKDINQKRCTPPLPIEEVETIAKSVSNYAPVRTNESEPVAPETLQYLLTFQHSDLGHSDLFAAYAKDKIKYNFGTDTWLVWNGSYWTPDNDGKIHRLAVECCREYRRAIININDVDTRESLFKHCNKLESSYSIKTMIDMSKSKEGIHTGILDWDVESYTLGVANGFIDLTTGKYSQGNPNNHISMSNGIVYDPEAKCPRWLQFMDEVFESNSEMINYVQKALGYSLTGDTKEQCLFLLVGSGGNGKSIFLEAIRNIAGDYGSTTPFSTFEKTLVQSSNTNDIARMNGKRLITASEVDETAYFNEARIKSLTGSEEQTARYLNKEFFSFRPKLKLWLSLNNPPKIRDTSEGMSQRLRRIDFNMVFRNTDKQDTQLDSKLKLEAPGILNWVIDGCLKYQKEGLQPPKVVVTSTEKYIENSDPLLTFVQDVCTTKENEKTSIDIAYKIYRTYCDHRGYKNYSILTMDKFIIRATKHYEKVEVDGKKYFNNLFITDEIKEQYKSNSGIIIRRASKNETNS